MKCKLLCVPTVLAVISALGHVILAKPGFVTTAQRKTRQTTAGHQGQDLTGKMFTLSMNRGGVVFFPPYYQLFSTTNSPYDTNSHGDRTVRPYYTTTRPYYPTTTRPYYTETPRTYPTTTRPYPTTTRPYTTTTRPYYPTTTRPYYPTTTRPNYTTTRPHSTYPPWTTANPFAGVSVCLRYLTDFIQTNTPKIFTLSPSSSSPLTLSATRILYTMTFDRYGYYRLSFTPSIPFWLADRDTWTRLCLTVDTRKNVAQVFSGSGMSIRKRLPFPFQWSGEPVIDFSGFDGQVTDVQVWDYPLSYREVYSYMNTRKYNPPHGSVLTWSYISYSPTGDTLVEDTYQRQAKQPISHRGRGRQPSEGKMKMEFFLGESQKGKRRQLK